ncbi:Hypothetical transmembrane protein [Flavobacterium branchiophilum]|uniref:Hypothetical transmembrane protein n=1 Tax=Flavobacterium branchiophilum (strain FL-15) TaxID=1034807 RepID=G2Z0L0_FLABF|nr:SHOCT domain-containing protein [Flavobacterium branchiophilum]CCB69409.1 Hypothetical transmembrane protein [Flavobacterium branchiophilum FL-15]
MVEHEIYIGLIVGLIFATTVYVWESKDFSQNQKIFLTICAICAPIQWFLILIFSISNSNNYKNSAEYNAKKINNEYNLSLDTSQKNLVELKEKGLITELEFSEKNDKIVKDKIKNLLINSIEYKQLKSLFDNNLLTQIEFENKKNILEEKVNKEYFTQNNEGEIIIYRDTIDDKKIKIVGSLNSTIGSKVFIDDVLILDDVFIYKSLTHKLIVKNGEIVNRFFLEKKDNLIFEKSSNDLQPKVGDKVYLLNFEAVTNGYYRYSLFTSFLVENGVIIK